MNIILKRNYHTIPEFEREYGCECKNCGTIFTFTGDEVIYREDNFGGVKQTSEFIECDNCFALINLEDCTWLRNKKEVKQFIKLHKASNEE